MKHVTPLGVWAAAATPGERFVYGRDDGTNRPASGVLREARYLREAGMVHLFQRREKSGALAYIAQRAGAAAGAEVCGELAAEPHTSAEMRRYRIIALMREGMSNRRIAEAVGSTHVTVAKDIYRMRKAGYDVPDRGNTLRPGPPCLVPGCGVRTGRRNSSGVCVDHRHSREHCRCELCTARREKAS